MCEKGILHKHHTVSNSTNVLENTFEKHGNNI